MALTNSERQKLFRERKKDQARKSPDIIDAYLKTPFSEWMGNSWDDVTTYLEWLGVRQIPNYAADGDTDPDRWEELEPDRKSIGRAERMVTMFLDGAIELARFINQYKTEEVNARIAEIEAADLTDPAVRKKALADIAMLSKYRDDLKRDVRWTLPQWKVKGE